jgi:DNA-directed RNA polymerase II subunit RPB9
MSVKKAARGLKFCPESNDLLYPVENPETRKLEYHCKNCKYVTEVGEKEWCVYVNEIKHKEKEKTVILTDLRGDHTLPRTRDFRCPSCSHDEAIYYSQATEQGMTMYFNCAKCGHRWHDKTL